MSKKNPTIRKDLKAHAAKDGNKIIVRSIETAGDGIPREIVSKQPAPLNLTPGHRDLRLIPKDSKVGMRGHKWAKVKPVAKGAFGGVTKERRREKFELAKADLRSF